MNAVSAHDAVKLLAGDTATPQHERDVHQKLAAMLCELLDIRPALVLQTDDSPTARTYYLPARTLTGQAAMQLNVHSQADFFGGWVSDPFIATKAISHPLFPGSQAPSAWQPEFARLAGDALLPGWTVFSKADAIRAGRSLLNQAPFRLKPVRATAGRGQQVIDSLTALERALAPMNEEELNAWGLVLEENLVDVETFSVGQVRVGKQTASYYGTQRLTEDNRGEWVYGGSDLNVYRGGYDTLLQDNLPPALKTAIRQARAYEQAVEDSYPGFFASRRNYDIAVGNTYDGRRRSGVLEQSWRVGGASSAEILALLAFHKDPGLQRVFASTHEVFGAFTAPEGAELFFQGDDAAVGLITKYARIRPYGHSE